MSAQSSLEGLYLDGNAAALPPAMLLLRRQSDRRVRGWVIDTHAMDGEPWGLSVRSLLSAMSKQWMKAETSNPTSSKARKPVSGHGARSGTIFTRSSEPASWIA